MGKHSENSQLWNLVKNFKACVLNVFKELKETMLYKVKKIMMKIPYYIENINKDKVNVLHGSNHIGLYVLPIKIIFIFARCNMQVNLEL